MELNRSWMTWQNGEGRAFGENGGILFVWFYYHKLIFSFLSFFLSFLSLLFMFPATMSWRMEDPTQTNVICLVRPAAEITESQNTARDLQGEAYIEESVTRIPDEPKRSRTDIGRFGANKFPELSYTFANERKRKVVKGVFGMPCSCVGSTFFLQRIVARCNS